MNKLSSGEGSGRDLKRFSLVLLVISAIYTVWYALSSTAFFPFETWFDQMRVILKYKSGILTLKDLFTTYGEHGMLGENILFLLNCKLFNLSNEAGAIVTMCVPPVIAFAVSWGIVLRSDKLEKWAGMLLISLIYIIMIPINIYGTGMNIQVRLSLVFFVLLAIQLDGLFNGTIRGAGFVILLFLTMFVGINVFGTLYSTAGYPCVMLYMLVGCIRKKENRPLRIAVMAGYSLCILLYFYEYGFIGNFRESGVQMGGSEGALGNLLSQLKDPVNLLKAFLAWCAGGFINHYSYTEKVIPEGAILLFGAVLLAFYVFGAVTYIRKKQYKSFYLPAFFMSYSLMIWIELLAGRPSDWTWYLGDWYTIHAKLLPLGTMLIFGYELKNDSWPDTAGSGWLRIWRPVTFACMALVVLIVSVTSCLHLWTRAPHAKKWMESRYKYLFVENSNDMPVNKSGYTPLQNTESVTMMGIETMRNYRLNAYYSTEAYKDANGLYYIGSSLKDCHILGGYYEDGWLAETAQLQIRTKEQGIIHLALTNPLERYIGQEGVIRIGDREYPVQIGQGDFSMEIAADPDQVVTVELDFSSFAVRPSEADQRVLSVILKDIYAE